MLIRYFDNKLRDIPEELAVAVLADPSDDGDISTFTSHWVNVIIHGVLASVFDDELSLEENIENAMKEFPEAPAERKEQARVLIKNYNIEVADEDIGMFPASDMI